MEQGSFRPGASYEVTVKVPEGYCSFGVEKLDFDGLSKISDIYEEAANNWMLANPEMTIKSNLSREDYEKILEDAEGETENKIELLSEKIELMRQNDEKDLVVYTVMWTKRDSYSKILRTVNLLRGSAYIQIPAE